jgi:hypothetical protein
LSLALRRRDVTTWADAELKYVRGTFEIEFVMSDGKTEDFKSDDLGYLMELSGHLSDNGATIDPHTVEFFNAELVTVLESESESEVV